MKVVENYAIDVAGEFRAFYFVVEETPDYRTVRFVTTTLELARTERDRDPFSQYKKVYKLDFDEIFESLLLRIAREVE